jgi:hypothetical protein
LICTFKQTAPGKEIYTRLIDGGGANLDHGVLIKVIKKSLKYGCRFRLNSGHFLTILILLLSGGASLLFF